MTDDERAARKWLEGASHQMCEMSTDARHRATIQRLLDRPVLPHPANVPDEVWEVVNETFHRFAYTIPGIQAAYRALYDHYTAPPKPRKIERWLVLNSGGSVMGIYRSLSEAGDQNWTGDYSIVHMVEADDDQ